MKKYQVALEDILDECNLKQVLDNVGINGKMLHTSSVNRPGLLFIGFDEYFPKNRLQIIGRMEYAFLRSQSSKDRKNILKYLFEKKPPAVIITRNESVFTEMFDLAKEYDVCILVTEFGTSDTVQSILEVVGAKLAPKQTTHGVLVEVYGEGILITGESGVGKSETAIELVHRGHRLVADDAVEITKISEKVLIGKSPDNIRHFMELRGIGIINVSRLFGIGAVKLSEQIDLIVALEPRKEDKEYDRMGLETKYTEILGVKVPIITIPVQIGRNLSNIIEISAKNNRQKKLGYNAAEDLLKNLNKKLE